MLTEFERQMTISLGSIKIAFKCSGLLLNAEFREYFLRVSTDRIKNTYDEFTINSMLEEQASVAGDASNQYERFGSVHIPNYGRDNTQKDINGLVEIIDSSDDEDQANNQVKMELLDALSTAQYADQLDGDGSYTDEMPNMNPSRIDCQDNDLKSSFEAITAEIDNAMEADDDKPFIVDTHRAMDSANERITLNNSTKVAKSFKTTGGPARSPRKHVESWLVRKSSSNDQSSAKKVKKRLKCQLCEYSSHYKHHINRHMLTHTGEKPFQCDVCRKGFTTLQSMKKHKVTHTKEIPFHCRGCFTGFSQEIDQESHEK
ncbi:zinc finger protein 57-like, partial [Contarinia nasturtii]|uniref:zinc finger protein 57-like n=1 Tax=Contarinia nasturtii TaxID=265458 RepID=UPI0012D3EC78